MDFKSFKKKLIRNRFSKSASFVLAAMTIVFLLIGALYLRPDKNRSVSYSEHKEEIGAYVYLDVYVFDDWICKYGDDTYYVLYDHSGNVYLSVLSDSVFRSMVGQEAGSDDYTHYYDGTSYRLYGITKRVNENVMSMVVEGYGFPGKDYMDYFGPCYLDTKDRPGSNTAWMWFTFAIFGGLFALVFFTVWIGSERLFNKENRDYSEEEFAAAARVLDETDKKQRLIFTDDFIINRRNGMLLRFRDILWVHLVNTSVNGVNTGRVLGIHTWKRNYFKIAPQVRDSVQELNDMINMIAEKKPDVLIGYTAENKKTYDMLTKN